MHAQLFGVALGLITGTLCFTQQGLAQPIQVAANPEWSTSTPFTLPAGTLLSVSATGTWTTGSWTGPPSGFPPPQGACYVAPDANPYALVGKLGAGGAPLPLYDCYVGVATTSDQLVLGMNDCPGIFWDNSGAVQADVQYCVTWQDVAVPADVAWTSSGYTLQAGERFSVSAQGSWTSGTWTGGPDGDPGPAGGCYPAWTANPYSLIARIGNGTPFAVGSMHCGTAAESGVLQLGMNDCPGILWDNSGQLTVSVGLVYDIPPQPWTDLGNGLAGSLGVPSLTASGSLASSTLASLTVENTLPNATVWFVIAETRADLPLFGGVLVPDPNVAVLLGLSADPAGTASITGTLPAVLPAGFEFYSQAWIVDPVAPHGFAATNALSGQLQ